MTIEAALVQLLNADEDFSSLVSGRLYPLEGPQDGDSPFVLYTTSGPDQELAVNGYINLFQQAVRFDCYGGGEGGGYKSAKLVARAIRNCLFGFLRGVITSPVTGESINVQGIFADGGEDGLEPPAHADGAGMDYVGVQVRVVWNE